MDYSNNSDNSDQELVTQWLNNAAVSSSTKERLQYFHKLQEILLRKSPNLLIKFLPNMLNFTTDRNPDVKKALVGFIEELCKFRESFIPKVMVNIHMLLCDESIPIQKRVIQALISIYRRTLMWICKSSFISEEMENAWKQLTNIKKEIANMIDSDNDGVRTSAVKFLECVILLQTYPDQAENNKPNDFSLDDVPLTLKIARRRYLEDEANTLFEKLIKFHGSPHISSANLLTCIGVLTMIAKNRAEFMTRVVTALESLYNNLPPTLTTTQVNSVRKKLKSELASLIRHPAAFDFVDKLTPMLIDLVVLEELGWQSGFQIPVANSENKKLEQELAELTLKRLKTISTSEALQKKIEAFNEHLKYIEEEELENQKLINLYRQNYETVLSQYRLKDTEIKSYEKDIKEFIKEATDTVHRTEFQQENVTKRLKKLEKLKQETSWDMEALKAWEDDLRRKEENNEIIEKFAMQDQSKYNELEARRAGLELELARKRVMVTDFAGEIAQYEMILERMGLDVKTQLAERDDIVDRWRESVTVLRQRDETIQSLCNALFKSSPLSRKTPRYLIFGIIVPPDFSIIIFFLLQFCYTQQDVVKMIPKAEDRRRYCKRTLSMESLQIYNKRPRLDNSVVTSSLDFDSNTNDSNELPAQLINEQYVKEKLTIDKVVQLIISNINNLPQTIPQQFIQEYSKYPENGSVGDVNIIAKLLTNQLVEAGLATDGKAVVKKSQDSDKKNEIVDLDDEKDEKEKVLYGILPIIQKKKIKLARIKTLKLPEITRPLERDIKEKLLIGSINRLLTSDKTSSNYLYQKLITTVAACFSPTVRHTVLTYLLDDLRPRIDLALAWLYEEYGILQGFSRVPPLRKDLKLEKSYNILLCTFINASMNDSTIFTRLLLEAPLITEEALEKIHELCRDEKKCTWALNLLRDLTLRKPPKQLTFLNALLSYTTFESSVVRDHAISLILELHKRPDLKLVIEEFARMNLEFLKLQRPPESLCGFGQGRLKSETWGDDFIKACLLPYISLLPANESLIHDLAKVYLQTGANIKRIILRLLEAPIRSMGMDSPDLLKLVEDCPKGSETLVTRVIHILTDKGPPSAQLVQRVRDLYNTRVSDVRFLIPVLNGLSKKEVIAALPKLIKLNPVVVKEVFNRLLGLHGDSPITPTELLVALHLIDSSKVDLKTIIKATSMCLQEKQVFTQEVLAVVLQQLMDQTPLPTLLMRTVIQALGSYPRLSGFVMNILQRLILKQVWKQKVVWEGFIKCCQRTKPQSFAVLMQLPPPQLSDALIMCPELKEPLREHFMNFNEAQRAHIPTAVQEILLGSFIQQNSPVPAPQQPPPAAVPENTTDTQVDGVSGDITSEPLPPGME